MRLLFRLTSDISTIRIGCEFVRRKLRDWSNPSGRWPYTGERPVRPMISSALTGKSLVDPQGLTVYWLNISVESSSSTGFTGLTSSGAPVVVAKYVLPYAMSGSPCLFQRILAITVLPPGSYIPEYYRCKPDKYGRFYYRSNQWGEFLLAGLQTVNRAIRLIRLGERTLVHHLF